MTNVLVHYAAGVALAALLRSGRRAKWAWGLIALVPDVDGVTALLLEPALHARSWTPPQAQAIAFVLAHRGLLHTVGFALAAGLLAWALAGRRHAFVGGSLLASHLALDMLSTWPLEPLWPITSANIHIGLLRVNDPAEIAAAALAIVALLLATSMRPRLRLTPRTLTIAAITLLAAPYLASAVSATNASLQASGTPTILHYPEYQFVQRDGIGYHVWLARADGTVYERTDVLILDTDTNTTPEEERTLVRVQCEFEQLGPLRWIDAPIFRTTPNVNGWIVTATDARAQQDPDSAPSRIVFDVTNETVTAVHVSAGESGFHGERDLDLPGTLATHATCAG